jgi:hypothetical protein
MSARHIQVLHTFFVDYRARDFEWTQISKVATERYSSQSDSYQVRHPVLDLRSNRFAAGSMGTSGCLGIGESTSLRRFTAGCLW